MPLKSGLPVPSPGPALSTALVMRLSALDSAVPSFKISPCPYSWVSMSGICAKLQTTFSIVVHEASSSITQADDWLSGVQIQGIGRGAISPVWLCK